jgi:hypothetical protein
MNGVNSRETVVISKVLTGHFSLHRKSCQLRLKNSIDLVKNDQ